MSERATPQRLALRAAQEALRQALGRLETTKSAARRGRDLAAALADEKRRLDAADQRAAGEFAAALAGWARGATTEAPEAQQRRLTTAQRDEVDNRVSAATAAAANLEAEVQRAGQECERARNAVADAISSIVHGEAVRLAEELAEARRCVWRLTDQIGALSFVDVPGAGRVGIPPCAAQVLSDMGRPQRYPGQEGLLGQWKRAWAAFIESLRADPIAEPQGLGGDAAGEGYRGPTESEERTRLARRTFLGVE